jgi:hypothetical protein
VYSRVKQVLAYPSALFHAHLLMAAVIFPGLGKVVYDRRVVVKYQTGERHSQKHVKEGKFAEHGDVCIALYQHNNVLGM